MRHGQKDIGQSTGVSRIQTGGVYANQDDFVLEKSIFSNIFEKDIRRVFIYKKAERLAKAIHLITPAFFESMSLKNRIDAIAVGLIDAAVLSPGGAKTALSRELLALSSVLSIARTSGILSSMNAELIVREAHMLLQEVADYEEPRLSFSDAPSLSAIAKNALSRETLLKPAAAKRHIVQGDSASRSKGHSRVVSDIHIKDRRESILSIIRDKRRASIKDISTLVRGVSEKTIQRELLSLVAAGIVLKQGERRWSTYSLA